MMRARAMRFFIRYLLVQYARPPAAGSPVRTHMLDKVLLTAPIPARSNIEVNRRARIAEQECEGTAPTEGVLEATPLCWGAARQLRDCGRSRGTSRGAALGSPDRVRPDPQSPFQWCGPSVRWSLHGRDAHRQQARG